MIETVVVWQKRGGVTQVPLADHHRGVALVLEDFGDGDFVGVNTGLGCFGSVVEGQAQARRVAAGHQRGARRSAERRRIEVRKPHAFARQPVDVWGANIGGAVNAEVPPSLVVSKDDDEIRLLAGLRESAGNEQKHQTANARNHSTLIPLYISVAATAAYRAPCRVWSLLGRHQHIQCFEERFAARELHPRPPTRHAHGGFQPINIFPFLVGDVAHFAVFEKHLDDFWACILRLAD